MSVPICDFARDVASEVCIDQMQHSGYVANIMAAEKLPDDGHTHPLPPGRSIPVIPIHCLPGCPEDWVRDSGSYVVPVKEDIGLWFDWRKDHANDYMTAVVPSVKGMNPITGQKVDKPDMEQYRDKCPVHDTPFAHGRYCEKCDYKWPAQNYVSNPNTLWWDGFAQPDGTVRQFFFTADDAKDIASLAIGKENTMPAFGFAFFRYKKEMPVEPAPRARGFTGLKCAGSLKHKYGASILTSYNVSVNTPLGSTLSTGDAWDKGSNVSHSLSSKSVVTSGMPTEGYDCTDIHVLSEEEGRALRPELYAEIDAGDVEEAPDSLEICAVSAVDNDSFGDKSAVMDFMGSVEEVEPEAVKEVAVGAGAAINQALQVDNRPLEDYHSSPQALIRIYFVFEPQLRDIVQTGGIKRIEGSKEGFLKGMPIGS